MNDISPSNGIILPRFGVAKNPRQADIVNLCNVILTQLVQTALLLILKYCP
jgi:hypothetical protein